MSSVMGHPRTAPKHLPTLQPHVEDELGDDEYQEPSTSSGGVVRQHSYPIERYNHQQRIQPTTMWPYSLPSQLLPGSSTRGPRTSALSGSPIAPPLEQDHTYYQEDEGMSSGDDTAQYEQEMAEFDQIIPATKEERERLEWQTMLRSVLDGDVLSAEKTRIGIDKENTIRDDHSADYRKNFPVADIWLGARARIRCRNIEEERKRVEHRRLRVGEGLVEDVLAFKYDERLGPPREQVNNLLRRLDAVESFYPSIKTMLLDKPAFAEMGFRERIDAMVSWANLAGMTQHHYALLQKWTGSQTLDVIAPNTNAELPLVTHTNHVRRGPHDREMVDATTFVERVLKEDSIVQIFKKRALVDIGLIISRSNENYNAYGGLYKAMNLPSGIAPLRELLVFPTILMHASLRVRLGYASKVKEMDLLRIDQMLDDFTISIREACKRKFEYEDLILGSSILQHCLRADYDDVVLEAVTTFFGLLQRKLKSVDGIRGTHFKETEFLEAQSDLLNDVAAAIDGGSILVAEQLWQVRSCRSLL
jgi:mitogen-activated protein kinase kinase kinase